MSARSTDDADHLPGYSYKPSVVGSAWEFRLAPDALEWKSGMRAGRIAYGEVRRLRLSCRPVALQACRFLTEVWSADGRKILLTSTTWRSMFAQERQDQSYRHFITELHRRLISTRSVPVFETGVTPIVYWVGALLLTVVVLALAALIVRAVAVQAWGGAAFIAGFLALFLWQMGSLVRRNRPGTYRPEEIPSDLLPWP
jgi:hypothetical protein